MGEGVGNRVFANLKRRLDHEKCCTLPQAPRLGLRQREAAVRYTPSPPRESAPTPSDVGYQYRKKVFGVNAETFSDSEGGSSDLNDFLASDSPQSSDSHADPPADLPTVSVTASIRKP